MWRFFFVQRRMVSAEAFRALTSLEPCGSSMVCDSTTSMGLRWTMCSCGSTTT